MKRVLSVLFCIAIIMSSLSFATFAAEKKRGAGLITSEKEIIDVVNLLEIMVGDQNGDMKLDSLLTRAQFVKMVIQASEYKNSVNKGTEFSPFPDVRGSHWASAYVYTASKNGIINGYLDGSFKPDNPVKLEEAATISLRLLGYTSANLVGAYPAPQLAKFSELGLDAGVVAKRGESISRRDCMYIVYNMLCSDKASGGSYCASLGYAVGADGIIDHMALVESESDGDFVYLEDGFDSRITFDVKNARVYRDDSPSSYERIEKYDYICFNNTTKSLWCYSEKAFGTVNAISDKSVTVNNLPYTLANSTVAYKFSAFGEIAKDDVVMLVLNRKGAVVDAFIATGEMFTAYSDNDTDLMGIIEETIKGPVFVGKDDSWKKEIPLDSAKAELSVTSNNNEKITLETIAEGDVLYYSLPFNTIYIYRKTETGVISSVVNANASGMPTAVVVGGKSFTLGVNAVKVKFYNGAFKKDDLATLILGRKDEVVDVKSADALDYSKYTPNSATYAEILNATISDPIVVLEAGKWEEKIPFDVSKASIYKDNSIISADDVKVNSVLYYSTPLKSVWVYDDSITGTYENCVPSRIAPTSVVVAGNTYALETSDAVHEFSSLGSFKLGDIVTVLVGRSGIVAVLDAKESVYTEYGVITGISEKQYTRSNGVTYTADCIAIAFPDGRVASYEHNDTGLEKGDFVKVTIQGGECKIAVTPPKMTSDRIAEVNKLIQSGAFAENAYITDVYGATLLKVYPSRLEGAKLATGELLYYSLDSDGNIETLMMYDVTGDMHKYMYVTDSTNKGTRTSATYTGYLDGYETTISAGNYVNIRSDAVAVVKYDNGAVKKMELAKGANVKKSDLTKNTCVVGEESFDIWSDASIYVYDSSSRKYVSAEIEDILGGEFNSISVYYDELPQYCGRIRLIMAR